MPFHAENRQRRKQTQRLVQMRTAADGMKNLRRRIALIGLFATWALPAAGQNAAPAPAQGQTQAPPQAQAPSAPARTGTLAQRTVTQDGREAMFTTMVGLRPAACRSTVT